MSLFEINLSAIGKRIETLRGNLSKIEFSERLNVDRKTVGTWEAGDRMPDTMALIALWREFNADPAWVLTGKGFEPNTSADERELLALFRGASLTGKAAAIGALQGAAGAAPVQNRVKARDGNAAGGDMTISNSGKYAGAKIGGVVEGNASVNIGPRKPK